MPSELWEYYLKIPELWDFKDLKEDGLQKGINAVLIAPHSVVPCWVEKESINKFVELKVKMTTLVVTLSEIKRFAEEQKGSKLRREQISYRQNCYHHAMNSPL